MAIEINFKGKQIAKFYSGSIVSDSEKAVIDSMSIDEIVSHATKSCSRIVLGFDPLVETKDTVFPTEILEQNDYTLTVFAVDSDKVVVTDKIVHCNVKYQGTRIDVSIPVLALKKVEYINASSEECMILFKETASVSWDQDVIDRMYEKKMKKEMAKSLLERKLISRSKATQTRPTETKFFLFRK